MKTRILQDKKLTTAAAFLQKFQDAEIIKYTPEKRGLFCVEIEKTNYFVKLYPKKFLRRNRGENIHLTGRKFWDLSQKRKVNFRVPMPVFWNTETLTLWQKKLDGVPAVEFLKSNEHIAFEIGIAIAHIADSKITPTHIFDWTEQIRDSRILAENLSKKFPRLKEKTEKLLNDFESNQTPQKFVSAHGDMHIDQWLFDGAKLGLLDFEDFSFADVERDLAFFTVQVEAEYGAEICTENVEKELLDGFRSMGKIVDEKKYKNYKAHKWLAKAAKAADGKKADEMLEKTFVNVRMQ